MYFQDLMALLIAGQMKTSQKKTRGKYPQWIADHLIIKSSAL